MSAARAAARAKPVLVVKSGRQALGAKAALTHTGALAGSDAVYDAAFRRAGLLRVLDLDELFAAAETLGHLTTICRQPAGDIDQRRRHRRARRRPAGGPRRATCRHFAAGHGAARCGAAADLVTRQPSRHRRRCRRSAIRRGAGAAARRRRERRRAGDERAHGARVRSRRGEIDRRRDRAPPAKTRCSKTGVRDVDRRRRFIVRGIRRGRHSKLRDGIKRDRGLHASRALPGNARPADGDAAQHAAGLCAGHRRRASCH